MCFPYFDFCLPSTALSESVFDTEIFFFNPVSPLTDLYEPSEPQQQQQQQQPRPQAVTKTRKQLQWEKALQQQCQRLGLQGGAAPVTPEQLLSAPQPKPCQPQQPGPTPRPPAAGDQRQSDSQEQQEGVTPRESCNGRDSAQPRPAKPNIQVERKKVELLVSR